MYWQKLILISRINDYYLLNKRLCESASRQPDYVKRYRHWGNLWWKHHSTHRVINEISLHFCPRSKHNYNDHPYAYLPKYCFLIIVLVKFWNNWAVSRETYKYLHFLIVTKRIWLCICYECDYEYDYLFFIHYNVILCCQNIYILDLLRTTRWHIWTLSIMIKVMKDSTSTITELIMTKILSTLSWYFTKNIMMLKHYVTLSLSMTDSWSLATQDSWRKLYDCYQSIKNIVCLFHTW